MVSSLIGASDALPSRDESSPTLPSPKLKASRDLEDGEINEESKSKLNISVPGSSNEHVDNALSESRINCEVSTMTSTPEPPLSPVSKSKCPPSPYDTLTCEELDHAKSLVLDLLGWGVEPEYLVSCGISSQIIHRIFTDLHLRPPSNLKLFIDKTIS